LLAERIECLGSHPELESAHESRVNRTAGVIQNGVPVTG
jgi:hypothetical protein